MHFLLSHIIQHSADRFPDHVAYKFGDEALTFSQFDRKVIQIANVLLGLGVKKGDRIGILMPRCIEAALAVHGILRAGAAFVPLDAFAPPARIQFVIKDCEISHLITIPSQQRSLSSTFSKESGLKTIIGMDTDLQVKTIPWETVFSMSGEINHEVRLLEDDLAYIMYTSGTTGSPKGIMHTHRSGLSYARLSSSLYDLDKNDVVGSHSPLYVDMSTFAAFSAPLAGATTVIFPEMHVKMPASLSQLMEQENLTVWYSVPLALMQLLHHGVLQKRNLTSLRWILYGGEPFPVKHLRSLMELWPHARFSNVYGPAEVNQCTYYHFAGLPGVDKPVPLGKVWDNTEALIVDANGQSVSDGEEGELLIRSGTRMQGYWRQPELTQKAFFTRTANSGLKNIFYRTGDLVKMNADGHLLFLGRMDRQVKVRGFRVELDSIEAVLNEHAEVLEGAVFPLETDPGEVVLEACVSLKADCTLEEDENTAQILREHMQQSLPLYAIPNSITFMPMLPRTAAGKINHELLKTFAKKT